MVHISKASYNKNSKLVYRKLYIVWCGGVREGLVGGSLYK
jgi:hypothetical protein